MSIGTKQAVSHTGASPTEEIIRREITQRGPITFARFMELALYHPEHGYYERALGQIGRAGDYYTSVSVGSVFGELLAFDFSSRLEEPGDERPALVECGAHDGRLALDILNWMQVNRSDLYRRLDYVIIEPSDRRRAAQRTLLIAHADRVRWRDGWREDEGRWVRGLIFANELLDSFPFHRLRWDAGQRRWREVGVGLDNDRMVFVELPDAEPGCIGVQSAATAVGRLKESDLPAVPDALAAFLPDGFQTDCCPFARVWWRAAARSLAEGAIIAIDYGLTREELLRPDRRMGTARAYSRHMASDRLLETPGDRDLTAHVDFTALVEEGEHCGLRTEGFESQERFLLRIVRRAHERGSLNGWTAQQRRALSTLTHPCHFGEAFRVLCQGRRGPGDR